MQCFLNALIFCSVGFFNFFLSNFDFVSDDVNIPFVNHGSRLIYLFGVLMDFTGKSLVKSICIYFHKSVISIVGTIGQKYRRVVCIR